MSPESFYPLAGVLELHPNGYGFLRDPKESYVRQLSDPFVPGSVIEKLGLREGVRINGLVQPARGNQGPRVREIYDVDGMNPDDYINIRPFDELTPINPEDWLRLETGQEPVSTRVMDILTPLGKGQRALIVAPPRSGKTMLLQQISRAIRTNYPDIYVIVLLIDERPEEVTDFKRAVDAEVVSSSLDCELESHVRLAQFVIQRCKRLAEMGKDVFLLLDSITRLARAFNKWVGNTGRTMSGGVDIKAMDVPKKIFSSARLNEEGGSLTIVGTALVDTGSRMDELIFQEFKGTGNMELVLDRRLAARRVWPGPLTLVLGVNLEAGKSELVRLSEVSRRAIAPTSAVGFRAPQNDFLQRVLTELNEPIALTSANLSGEKPATNAQEAKVGLGDRPDLIVDDGPAAFGAPSTVVKVAGAKLEILREGAIPSEKIHELCARAVIFVCTGNICRSPMAE
ncbi:MAG: transcription termination factor Rho, partial [Thermoguttaceae bacterium]|nr:transcription termination factor Rho [Thermoguttaceae bacterium]